MLKKPANYDEIEVNLDFTPISVGGHKGIIMGVEEYTSEFSGNTSLKVSVDTAKDDN
jgi:allantoicase